MATRRFGPTNGAGVVVIELDANKVLAPAPLGVTAYIGVMERGDVGKLISTYSKRQMQKKAGGIIPDSLLPDCAADFWDHSNGAGEMHLVRVTDGTERAAERIFYSRDTVLPTPCLKVAAKNGGRWGSKFGARTGLLANTSSINQTTIATGLTLKVDEFKGGTITLPVPAKTYTIVSNDAAGLMTLSPDATAKTDYASNTDLNFTLELARDTSKEVAVVFDNPGLNDSTLFSMTVLVNGLVTKKYANLSMDPNSPYWVESIVNNDDSNDEVTVTSQLASNTVITSLKRPCNGAYAVTTCTATVLTAKPLAIKAINSPTGANPALAAGTTTDAMKYRDRLLVTMTSSTAFNVTSQELAPGVVVATGTLGSPVTPVNPIYPPFTLTNGSTILANADTVELLWLPFVPSALIGGYVYPDFVNSPLTRFRISANDHKSVTIGSGDMTTVWTTGELAVIAAPQPLGGTATTFGYDGIAGIADANFVTAMDVAGTVLKDLIGQNKGLVKLATPGKNSTLVQKAGLNLAEAMNWQYTVEVPSNTTTEDSALNYINNTIGRSDMGVTFFPSYAYVDDPLKPGQNKLIPMTGMRHGREALVAKNYDGYHKAAAGLDVAFPRVIKLPAKNLNEEVLNPQGINVIKVIKGSTVVWGDRTICLDPAWTWKHQRELMSHYENRMRESFDYIVFAINDPSTAASLQTTLQAFFLPEWTKGALQGKTFKDACSIDLGDTQNSTLTRASGDLNAEIKLRLADTVERFIIKVGKAGIFESLS